MPRPSKKKKPQARTTTKSGKPAKKRRPTVARVVKTKKPVQKKARKQRTKTVRRTSPLLLRYRYLLFSACSLFFIALCTMIIIRPVETEEVPIDMRPARIDRYFAAYNMPLAGYGEEFVAAADKCGMDWRLLPAIAVRESTGGKRMMNNNPFGWGGAHIPFTGFEDAIEQVGSHLCGLEPSTARWYGTTSIEKKLYYYNGTVILSYPKEVMWIMDQI